MKKKINSRDKGAAGERELSRLLNNYGYNTFRSQQYCGTNGDADVKGIDGMHIECKRYKRIKPGELSSAMGQSIRDARDSEMPVVFFREDYKEWKTMFLMSDYVEMWVNWKTKANVQKEDLPPSATVIMDAEEFMDLWGFTRGVVSAKSRSEKC